MAKTRDYPNQPMENGLYRIEHTKSVMHSLRIPQDKHDELRKRLRENHWHETGWRYAFDAHETWTKGQNSVTFPGHWTPAGHWDIITFETSIITGHTDYTKEEWDKWWADRKAKGYIVLDSYEIPKGPIVTYDKLFTKRYTPLDRARERARQTTDELFGGGND